ncbi:hypothetical protein TWF696_001086 [Orbilia brochopaga]|uniref:Uncharacterized protein n=1 Tax=Orbilia brochopaga TaxID=3140254 RepID=A0AAV9VDT4_9PEZI
MATQIAQSPDGRINNLVNLRNWVTIHHDTYPAIDPLKADLNGKSVVITGASKGVGYATALSFARAGCSKIAISARSPLDRLASEIRDAALTAGRAEPTVLNMAVDVTSETDVRNFATQVAAEFTAVDILINNAGYLEEWTPFAETKPDEWWKTWEVNIRGLYLCSRYFLPLVLKSPTRTIINVSSNGAHVTSRGASAYQASKFAVCRLAEFMTNDHWDDGLVAIAVHPGSVMTELAKGMPAHMHAVLVDKVQLPADAMVWLGKERREWLRGRYVMTNWDVGELGAKREEIVKGDLLKFRLAV